MLRKKKQIGIFDVPESLCAAMYLKGITDFSRKVPGKRQVEEFHIIDIKDDILNLIQDAYQKWKKDPLSIDPEN
ncbi:hypothetical protein KUTeg_005601 [Tegillarca granosa]|uniref:Uncharacterized protein n=1 Tax=Tegillarca granosa TaxID=220873 RepID=A0ABQ9FP27_TEGGR|nr:hypothetical protein KUTeg_005601 [Tegillarca granosa]